jgi:WD40 repeat protein
LNCVALTTCFGIFVLGENSLSINISADNSVVAASSQGCVCAWQVSTGQRLFFIEGHDTQAPVSFIKKNDVSVMATIIGNSIKLYSLKTRKRIQEFVDVELQNSSTKDNGSSLFSFKTSLYYMVKDGAEVPGSSVRVLDISTGVMEDVLKFDGMKGVSLVGISAYGTLLISQGEPMGTQSSRANVRQKGGAVIELWDHTKNKRLRCLNNPDDNMHCYAMSSDKTNVVTLNDPQFLSSANVFQGLIKVFNLQTDDVKECTLRFPSSIHLIRYVDFNHFISSSRDKLVRVWDLTRNLAAQETQDDELEIVDSFGDKIVFAQQVKVGCVDIRSGHRVLFVNGHAPQLVFLNKTQAVVTNGENMFLFDLMQRKLICKFQGETRSDCQRSLFVCNESEVVAMSLDGKSLNIYDAKSGNEIAQLKSDEGHSIARFVQVIILK